MGRWRAAVLILVHVVMAVHIVQWLITGLTLSPVEPSESMQTLREGVVNAGFVFFFVAIVATLIFGRFFCGWGCHIIALQDLCAWIMMKLGVKPKPFRSRLMLYMPLALALYMFVWPVFHREVIRPIFADAYGRLPSWLGQSEPLPSLRTEFFVADYWATFAAIPVAIPFVLVCTFGIVYFLGAKGFCTYGCPYGGFFAPADLLAPGKIRVTDACHHCGHCTAVCTSNVRVHEEVRDFGMVTDPGCMKCLDCISVCPNDALYFGLGAPTILAKPRNDDARARRAAAKASRQKRFDMTPREDWAIAILFVAMFLAFRGMLNQVPMLMAVAMAAIGAALTHKLYRCLTDPSVRLQHHQLKVKGRWTLAGRAFALLTVVTIVAAIWSGFVRFNVWRANELAAQANTPWSATLRPDFVPTPAEQARAQRTIAYYSRGGPFSDGGIGWSLAPDEQARLAHAHAVVGDFSAAEHTLRALITRATPSDELVFQTTDIVRARAASTPGAPDPTQSIDALYREALDRHPHLDQVRAQLAAKLVRDGKPDQAFDEWSAPLSEKVVRASALFGAAGTRALANQPDNAVELVERAAADHPHDPATLLDAARFLAALNKPERAKALADQALSIPTNRGLTKAAAAGFLVNFGDLARARDLADQAVTAADRLGPHAARSGTLQSAAGVFFQTDNPARGLDILRKAIDAIGNSPWDLDLLGVSIVSQAMQPPAPELLQLGVRAVERARDLEPDSPTIRHDLAQVYYAAGQLDKSLVEMKLAAEKGAQNPLLAEKCAELLNELGKHDEARAWAEKAAQRRKALPKPD
jgi:polyferredoxin/tetratricopeptide (TPR) repeat protein